MSSFSRVTRAIFVILCIVVSILFFIGAIGSFIPPSSFKYITFFTLAFPFLFLLQVVLLFIALAINKKLALLLFVTLLTGYINVKSSFAFNSAEWQNQKPSDVLRVMTWNVENFVDLSAPSKPGAKTRLEMLSVIKECNPDVLCFQEYRNIERGIRRVSVHHELDSLGYKYSYRSKDVYIKRKQTEVIGGVAIYAKQPLKNTGAKKIRTETLNESLCHAEVLLNNKPVRIFTAHLASFELELTDPSAIIDERDVISRSSLNKSTSLIRKLINTELIHERQVQNITNELGSTNIPEIYCGDINTTPASYNYRKLKGDMQDAFLQKGFGLGTTYYKLSPTLRIDVCLVDADLKVVQCKVISKKLSDHYPVVTDVAWK